jgi:hypothetical protein
MRWILDDDKDGQEFYTQLKISPSIFNKLAS